MHEDRATWAVFAVLILFFTAAAFDFRLPWASAAAGEVCTAHGKPAATCAECNPKLARGGTFTVREREPKEGECPNTLARITLSAEAAHLVPVDQLYTVQRAPIAETLRANAESRFPPDRYARVATRISGVVRRVNVRLGETVEAGASLATLDSPAFGQLKSDFLQARGALAYRQQVFETERDLFEKKVTPEREFLDAKTAFEEAQLAARQAEQKLAWLGLSPEQIAAIAKAQDASAALELPAPFAGQVIEAKAVIGETAEPDRPVFTVADGTRMWVQIDVYESDLARVEAGQKVVFHVESLPDRHFPGKIVAVGGEVDDRTRTVPVFAEVKNGGGLLRANMFGAAEIAIRPAEPKVLIPKSAVQNDGDCNLVFVSPLPNVYQARKVELGTVFEGGYEIRSGLAEGERIATAGSFLLKTEVLRGQIGAG